jgi:hypothetical protein
VESFLWIDEPDSLPAMTRRSNQARRLTFEATSSRISRCFPFPGNSGSPLALKGAMFNKNNSFKSFALTFAIGAVAGAALALLYAPMTGTKMQKKVADATEKVIEVVEGSVDNIQNVLRKVANA